MLKRKSSVSKFQISAPVELISTTNMISYTAPTLYNSPLSTTTVSTSGRFFPLAASPSSSHTSSPSSSDAESPSPPTTPTAAGGRHNHLSAYFAHPPSPPPMSPARSLSTRSISLNSMGPQRSVSTSGMPYSGQQQRKSHGPPPRTLHRSMRRSNNPFGAELAKVSEIAEEFGVRGMGDVDEEFMYSHGLRKYCADDYLQEIGNHTCLFGAELPLLEPGWI